MHDKNNLWFIHWCINGSSGETIIQSLEKLNHAVLNRTANLGHQSITIKYANYKSVTIGYTKTSKITGVRVSL